MTDRRYPLSFTYIKCTAGEFPCYFRILCCFCSAIYENNNGEFPLCLQRQEGQIGEACMLADKLNIINLTVAILITPLVMSHTWCHQVQIQTHAHTHARTHTRAHAHTHTPHTTHTCTHMHTCKHTHTHTHTHTRTRTHARRHRRAELSRQSFRPIFSVYEYGQRP